MTSANIPYPITVPSISLPSIHRGDSWRVRLWLRIDSTPQDLSAFGSTWQGWFTPGDAAVTQYPFTVDTTGLASGWVIVSLTPVQTRSMTAGHYQFVVQAVQGSGAPFTVWASQPVPVFGSYTPPPGGDPTALASSVFDLYTDIPSANPAQLTVGLGGPIGAQGPAGPGAANAVTTTAGQTLTTAEQNTVLAKIRAADASKTVYDLADTFSNSATPAPVLNGRVTYTNASAIPTALAVPGSLSTPPARHAVRNGTAATLLQPYLDSNGNGQTFTLLPGQSQDFKHTSRGATSGWEPIGGVPVTALDARNDGRYAPAGIVQNVEPTFTVTGSTYPTRASIAGTTSGRVTVVGIAGVQVPPLGGSGFLPGDRWKPFPSDNTVTYIADTDRWRRTGYRSVFATQAAYLAVSQLRQLDVRPSFMYRYTPLTNCSPRQTRAALIAAATAAGNVFGTAGSTSTITTNQSPTAPTYFRGNLTVSSSNATVLADYSAGLVVDGIVTCNHSGSGTTTVKARDFFAYTLGRGSGTGNSGGIVHSTQDNALFDIDFFEIGVPTPSNTSNTTNGLHGNYIQAYRGNVFGCIDTTRPSAAGDGATHDDFRGIYAYNGSWFPPQTSGGADQTINGYTSAPGQTDGSHGDLAGQQQSGTGTIYYGCEINGRINDLAGMMQDPQAAQGPQQMCSGQGLIVQTASTCTARFVGNWVDYCLHGIYFQTGTGSYAGNNAFGPNMWRKLDSKGNKTSVGFDIRVVAGVKPKYAGGTFDTTTTYPGASGNAASYTPQGDDNVRVDELGNVIGPAVWRVDA